MQFAAFRTFPFWFVLINAQILPYNQYRAGICPHWLFLSFFISVRFLIFYLELPFHWERTPRPLLHYAAGSSSLSLSSLWRASRLHVFSIRAKLSTDAAASLQLRRLFHVALKYSDCQTALGDEKGRLLAFSPTGPTSAARGFVTAPKLSQMFEPFVMGRWHFISRPHFKDLTLLVARRPYSCVARRSSPRSRRFHRSYVCAANPLKCHTLESDTGTGFDPDFYLADCGLPFRIILIRFFSQHGTYF